MPPVTGKSGLAATKGEIEILTNNIKFCRDEQMLLLLLLLLLYCSLKFIGIVKIIYFHYCFTIIVFWGVLCGVSVFLYNLPLHVDGVTTAH